MSTTDPAAIAAAYLDALGRGDAPTAMSMLSHDVVWHQPGANRFSGVHVGPDAVGAMIGGMMQVSEGTFELTPTGPAMANGELVAQPVQFAGTREGASMRMAGIDLLTVRDGRITHMHLFSGDAAAEDAFWGRA